MNFPVNILRQSNAFLQSLILNSKLVPFTVICVSFSSFWKLHQCNESICKMFFLYINIDWGRKLKINLFLPILQFSFKIFSYINFSSTIFFPLHVIDITARDGKMRWKAKLCLEKNVYSKKENIGIFTRKKISSPGRFFPDGNSKEEI